MSVFSGLAGRLPQVGPAAHLPTGRYRFLNIVLAAAVAGLAAVAYFAVGSTTPSTTTAGTIRTAPVARGVVLSSVSASGSIVAAATISVGFQTAGQLTEVDVKQGQRVQAGQVLARIDATNAMVAVAQAEAGLQQAQANLQTTLTGETAEQRAADALSLRQTAAQITSARVSLANAQRQLTMDLAAAATSIAQANRQLRTDLGNQKAAVAQLKTDLGTYANLDAAQAAVTFAQSAVANDQVRLHNDSVAQSQLQLDQTQWNQILTADKASNSNAVANDQAALNSIALRLQQLSQTTSQDNYQLGLDQAVLATAQATVGAIKADRSSITSYQAKLVSDRDAIAAAQTNRANTTVKDRQSIDSANQQVVSAQLSLRSAKLGTAIKQAPPTVAAVAQQRASVLQAQAALASAQRTLGQTTLRAPVAAVVASVGGSVGDNVSGGGISTTAGSASAASSSGSGSGGSSSSFVSLIGLTGMQVTAAFSESDAAKIQVGQPATVTVSALPSEELAAHVIEINPTGTTSSGVVQYTVTLALDRTEPKLKPGMSANAAITVAERDNVLNVPSAAVTGSGSSARVTVDVNGVQTVTPIVAGLQGDTNTEIVSGVRAGQLVVTSTGAALFSAGTGTTSTPTRGLGALFGGGGFGGGGGGRVRGGG